MDAYRESHPSVLEYQIYQHESWKLVNPRLCRGFNNFHRRVLIYLIFQDTRVRFYLSPNIILKSFKKKNDTSSKRFYSESAVHLHCDITAMLWRHSGSDDITMVQQISWVKRYLQYWHHNGRTIKSDIYSTDITMVEQSNKPLNGSNDIYCCRYRFLFESDIYCENTVLGGKLIYVNK